MKTKTSHLEDRLKHSSKESLSSVLKDISDIDFVTLITQFLEEHELQKSDVIKNTNLDRTYAYQIFSGERIPGKDKVIQLCLALHCNLTQTNRLLKLSDNAPLYAKIKRDAVIIFAINESNSVMMTNELLNEHGFEEL